LTEGCHYVPVSTNVDERLSRALVAFVSGETHPTIDEVAVIAAVGEVEAIGLLPRLRAIVDEVFEVPIEWSTHSYEPYVRVQDVMRRAHPELAEDAIQALGRYFHYEMM
jgi:hypothetical protein